MKASIVALLLVLGFCLGLCGCAPKEPMKETIAGASGADLAQWRKDHVLEGRLDEAFTLSIQELKLIIQAAQLASGAEEVQDYLASTLDGASVGSFVRWGMQARYERCRRLKSEWELGLQKGLEKISQGTLQIDSESKRVQIQDAKEHMAVHEAEMAKTLELAKAIGVELDTTCAKPAAKDFKGQILGGR